ncbi:MAG: hypothetical protein N2314_00530 [Brevinematales bacterium]|nr:hypothetical protein [Brevinematales bacterium]
MMWWVWLLVPLFPTNEIPMMKTIEVVYPVRERVISYQFLGELSPFLSVESKTNDRGVVMTLSHVSLSPLTLPPLEVTVLSNGRTNRLLFEGWVLRVAPTNVMVSNLHPVADIYPIYDLWWIGWLLLVLVIGGGVGWFFWHKNKKKEVFQEPPLSEDLEGFLERLRKEGETMEEKAYYSEVAYFIRCVLEKAYGFPAKEMGSQEIKAMLPVDKERKESILDVLKWCDRVKYAKHTTSPEKRREILQESEKIYQDLFHEKEEKP